MGKFIEPRSMTSIALAALVIGCSPSGDGGGGVAGDSPCDPFAVETQPVEIRVIMGIGRDDDGTIYVVERDSAEGYDYRVFASDADVLRRQQIGGSGEYAEGNVEHFEFQLYESDLTLILELEGDEVRMMTSDQVEPDPEGDPAAITPLEVVDEAAIEGMTFENLPAMINLEALAEVDTGDLIVVTTPDGDWTEGDIALFYGSEDALRQREITEHGASCCSVYYQFDLDGEPAELWFRGELTEAGYVEGPADITIGDHTHAVTRLAEDVETARSFTYLCL